MQKFFLLSWIFTVSVYAQPIKDSIPVTPVSRNLQFNYKQLVIPSVLLAYGVIGLQSNKIQQINEDVRDKVKQPVSGQTKIDNITAVVPALSVYALNALGVKGRNNFRDRTVILITASAITYATVLGLKKASHVKRPDGSTNDSFPSGHTATAFAGAEFLRQEYKDESVWYGVAGYVVATGTGFLRIANDRHWLTDVAAGAGIGIFGTKIAYWINPVITDTLFPGKGGAKSTTAVMAPFFNGRESGLTFVMTF